MKYNAGWRCLVYLQTVIILIIVLMTAAEASAAAPDMAWNKTFPLYYSAEGRTVLSTGDGYLIGGNCDIPRVWPDFFLVKTDLNGNTVWNRTYYNPDSYNWSSLFFQSMAAAGDGYVVAGEKYFTGGGHQQPYLIRLDRNFNITWSKAYRLHGDDFLVMPADGGYLITGRTGARGLPYTVDSGLALKVDQDGNETWTRSYSAPGAAEWSKNAWNISYNHSLLGPAPNSWFNDALATGDGYIFAGSVNGSAWLIKTDLNGNEAWNRTYGRGAIYAIVNASDGYVFLSNSQLVRTDVNGNVIGRHGLGEYLPAVQAGSLSGLLVAVRDGYVMAGQVNASDNKSILPYLVKTDLDGNMTWNTTYAMPGFNYVDGLVVDQGAYVLMGNSRVRFADYNETPWLLKTVPDDAGASAAMPAMGPILAILAVVFVAIATRPRK